MRPIDWILLIAYALMFFNTNVWYVSDIIFSAGTAAIFLYYFIVYTKKEKVYKRKR